MRINSTFLFSSPQIASAARDNPLVPRFALLDEAYEQAQSPVNEGAKEKKGTAQTQQAQSAAKEVAKEKNCLLYTSPSPRDKRQSRMPSSA